MYVCDNFNRVTTQIVVESDREDTNPKTTSLFLLRRDERLVTGVRSLEDATFFCGKLDPGADLPSAMVLSDIQVFVWSQ